MQGYAEALDFERANEFKEKIDLLTDYQSKSTIVSPKLNNIDVYGYTETDTIAFINYLRISNGSIVQAKAMELKRVLDETREELLTTAITEYSLTDELTIDEILLHLK
jgi:excinuclease ABC subunit C